MTEKSIVRRIFKELDKKLELLSTEPCIVYKIKAVYFFEIKNKYENLTRNKK